MALHEHPTLYHQPTSTTIRLVSPYPILYHCNLHVQLLCTWYSDYPAVTSEQRIHIILLLLYGRRSTRGTRKYSKVYPMYHVFEFEYNFPSPCSMSHRHTGCSYFHPRPNCFHRRWCIKNIIQIGENHRKYL